MKENESKTTAAIRLAPTILGAGIGVAAPTRLGRESALAGGREVRSNEIVSFGPFRLVAARRLLLRNDTAVAIGSRAFDILVALIDRAGDIVSNPELTALVWTDVNVDGANLRVNMYSLRKTLGERKGGPRYIVNVPGRGYSFVEPLRRTVSDDFPIAATPSTVRQSLPARSSFLVGWDETIAWLSARRR